MLRLRQEALHKAHEEQETTPRTLFRTSMDFRPLSEVTPVPVPFQSTDLSLRYPTKNFTMEHGAMYRDQFSAIHDKWAIDVMLLTAHYEDSRAAFQIPFNAADAIPVPVPFWVRPTFFMTDLEYGFVDPP